VWKLIMPLPCISVYAKKQDMRGTESFTKDELQIIGVMLEDPIAWHAGLAASAAARIPSGTGYPMLARLEKAGWLESRWEESRAGGPRRRLYRLTGLGQRLGSAALAETLPTRRRPRLRLGFPARKESLA
jgi:PadR family transcriptional regulator PadR